jgi:hypothetical protein
MTPSMLDIAGGIVIAAAVIGLFKSGLTESYKGFFVSNELSLNVTGLAATILAVGAGLWLVFRNGIPAF